MRDVQTAARTVGSTENAEDILGQFYYAFGQGAGAVRVERGAIAAFRNRYFANIKAAPAPWNAVAGNVLSLIAQVGRLAALYATQEGRSSISAADFMRARVLVEAKAHPRANDTGQLIAGPYCRLIPGEEDNEPGLDTPMTPEMPQVEELRARTH
jgi:hypothetical protein